MASHANNGRRKKAAPFVMLPKYMVGCPAWRKMSGSALKVYCVVDSRFMGSNNGQISLSVREAAEAAGLAIGTARKALAELQELGFIRCHMKGSYSLKIRHASEWEITVRPLASGKPAKKTFMSWHPILKKNNGSNI